jgi:hypothetical protein
VTPEELTAWQLEQMSRYTKMSGAEMRRLLSALTEAPPEPERLEDMPGSRQVCPECRTVDTIVVTCAHANKVWVSSKWRAPKRNNDRAWKRIAEGDLLWDDGAVQRKAARDAQAMAAAEERMRRKRRSAREESIRIRKGS